MSKEKIGTTKVPEGRSPEDPTIYGGIYDLSNLYRQIQQELYGQPEQTMTHMPSEELPIPVLDQEVGK